MQIKGKIINDPVYGFIKIPEQDLMQIIEHPWFQRLRNIRQMGMAHLVYPGAVHTRFHHSLGACHLMGKALDELSLKNISIEPKDYLAARMAILLHDIGHGPFSHALENSLVEGVSHEQISLLIMKKLNLQMDGKLSQAMEIFDYQYPKKFLHQLVSSQLDVDRMDYLNRDSFYTGVSEGVIGYDRILQMLTVGNNELMVEEKGVHSVEKFIIARRLMYWQVYLHKAVLGAELLLVNILKRAKELAHAGHQLFSTPSLAFFLFHSRNQSSFEEDENCLEQFCQLDDSDILTCIKEWTKDKDFILSKLCQMIQQRKLYKTQLGNHDFNDILTEKKKIIQNNWGLKTDELEYFAFIGTTSSSTYNTEDERITIAMKDGRFCDISDVDNPLVNQALAKPVHKNYICYLQP